MGYGSYSVVFVCELVRIVQFHCVNVANGVRLHACVHGYNRRLNPYTIVCILFKIFMSGCLHGVCAGNVISNGEKHVCIKKLAT